MQPRWFFFSCQLSPQPYYCSETIKLKTAFLWLHVTFRILDPANSCLAIIFWLINFREDIPIYNFIKFLRILNTVFLNMMNFPLQILIKEHIKSSINAFSNAYLISNNIWSGSFQRERAWGFQDPWFSLTSRTAVSSLQPFWAHHEALVMNTMNTFIATVAAPLE